MTTTARVQFDGASNTLRIEFDLLELPELVINKGTRLELAACPVDQGTSKFTRGLDRLINAEYTCQEVREYKGSAGA